MDDGEMPQLGVIVKRLRLEKGFTLDELSRLTTLSKATLSKVENNKTSLTYDNIVRLSRGLKVNVDELFGGEVLPEDEPFTGRRTVGRQGEGRLITTVNYGDCYLCSDLAHKKIIPTITYVTARSLPEFGPFSSHSGEEFTYVIDGAVEFHCDAYEPVLLRKGDYIYFDSAMPHAYISVGEVDATLLTAMSAPDPEHF